MKQKACTEYLAIELVRNYYEKEWEVEDISKAGMGADLRLLKKDESEPVYLEVKGMYQKEPVAFRIYKNDKARAECSKMFFCLVYDLYNEPKLIIVDGKKILEWLIPSGQKDCFKILDIRQKIKEAGLKPISLKE